jgi:DNA-binding CsgD family transcriptional regulator
MESARMEHNRVSQEFLQFVAENAKGSLLVINERRFSQLMAQYKAALERYSAALQRVHSSVSSNKGSETGFGTFLPNHEYWLTNRQRQVLYLLIAGHSTKQVAAAIGISFKTVALHRHHIMRKMDVHETASMVRKALLAGFGWESVRSPSTASGITPCAQVGPPKLAREYSYGGLPGTSQKRSAKGGC